jgi:ABC-type nickel/cobalt efflux system permease component RcnA
MIFSAAGWLLIGAVAGVGVLHTVVPDHWVPITLVARQRGWTRTETARAALVAGTGHVLSTLAIAVVVWIAGVAVAKTFGHLVGALASVALVLFGGWIAISSLLEMRNGAGHGHSHNQVAFASHEHHDGADHGHDHAHGPDHAAKLAGNSRTALLLILGSSPMVEGIPAFFAAGRYGPGLIITMSLVFGIATIVTYVVLCVGSLAGLQRVSLGPLERYGEVLSGAFIAAVGVVFWVWPVL